MRAGIRWESGTSGGQHGFSSLPSGRPRWLDRPPSLEEGTPHVPPDDPAGEPPPQGAGAAHPRRVHRLQQGGVFADGALPEQTKQLIAVAVAHVTQCPYCIQGHTALALRSGNTQEQIMEAIWVAAEMRAGAAYAHSSLAVERMLTDEERSS